MAMRNNLLFVLLIASMSVGNAKNVNLKQQKATDNSIVFLRSFFKWYKTKYDYLDNHIFPVAVDPKNNAPYRIDFKATEKYLSILKSSGFFSDDYIQSQRDNFKKIDAVLQKSKQNDGPVDGLDFDPIVHSQEPEAMLENLDAITLKVINTRAENIRVKVYTKFNQGTYLLYYLKKSGDKYLIDRVDFLINGVAQIN